METLIKIKDKNGSLLSFYLNEDGEVEIGKNNYLDLATLTRENAQELMMFLNTILS